MRNNFVKGMPAHSPAMALLLTIVLSALMILPAFAADETYQIYKNDETGYGAYIQDDANLLSEEEKASLLPVMRMITAYGNVLLYTTDSNYNTTDTRARQVYDEYFGSASGTMLIIDMDNREIVLRSHGAVSKTITKAYANTITDNVYTYASNGDYAGCAKETFSQVITLLTGGRIAQPMKYISLALFSLSAAILINFLLLKASRNSALRKIEPAVAKAEVSTHHVAAAIVGLTVLSSVIHTRVESSSGSGGGGGGGFSGGGGGGGGFSGGSSGGHRF